MHDMSDEDEEFIGNGDNILRTAFLSFPKRLTLESSYASGAANRRTYYPGDVAYTF
jgi:hypothetical protein